MTVEQMAKQTVERTVETSVVALVGLTALQRAAWLVVTLAERKAEHLAVA